MRQRQIHLSLQNNLFLPQRTRQEREDNLGASGDPLRSHRGEEHGLQQRRCPLLLQHESQLEGLQRENPSSEIPCELRSVLPRPHPEHHLERLPEELPRERHLRTEEILAHFTEGLRRTENQQLFFDSRDAETESQLAELQPERGADFPGRTGEGSG